jgi:hypothetical protein
MRKRLLPPAGKAAYDGSAVGVVYSIFGVLSLLAIFPLPIWALRRHSRMFPKGWDRTGWKPERDRARRFETMWTYFSGRGGGGG